MARKRYLKKTALRDARELFLDRVAAVKLESERSAVLRTVCTIIDTYPYVPFAPPRHRATIPYSPMARNRHPYKPALRDARELFLDHVAAVRLESETLPVAQALNRITAEPVFARRSSPHYHGSAMDGICVRAEDTFGATEFNPKKLKLTTGDTAAP